MHRRASIVRQASAGGRSCIFPVEMDDMATCALRVRGGGCGASSFVQDLDSVGKPYIQDIDSVESATSSVALRPQDSDAVLKAQMHSGDGQDDPAIRVAPGTFTARESPFQPPDAAEDIWRALRRVHEGVPEVRLVRATWLKQQARARCPLKHRQELEADPQTAREVFVDVDELRELKRGPDGQLPIAVLSYAWEMPEHPDPEAATMRALCARLSRMQDEANATRRGHHPLPSELGVFVDWCSLCQKGKDGKRTDSEERAFRGALGSMEMWYAHPLTTVVKVSEVRVEKRHREFKNYTERGWPTFESHVAVLAKRSSPTCWPLVVEAGETIDERRTPPLTVEAFGTLLTEKRFTNDTDQSLVLNLYKRTLDTYLAPAPELQLSGLGWGNADAAQLARILPLCRKLVERPRSTARNHPIGMHSPHVQIRWQVLGVM